ncbi:hypothetical protein KUF71_010376 [Frankliniella fusca]|uniref:Uncharacterized protein n=1 Tax=Frankliniella fusca TaxID=407009 RepID=A0AAE1HGY5_9NEOP|nr:hypothetical protein KUF71_010376 [Frankliniella fusca]
MPAALLLFHESLEGIKLRLSDPTPESSDAADTLSSLLQVFIELLKCMECVLQYIASQGSVNISVVPSVPKTVAVLLLKTFRHCRESETLYGDLFTMVSDVLSAVFRQCYQVQSRFFSVISSSINFDCSVETDVALLVEVLQILSEIGEQVTSLDIKTMAEQWKGYAKVLQLYLEPIRERLNIAYPISYLCLETKNNLEQLTRSPKDIKCTSRLIKTTSFILKIIAKLCEQFGGGHGYLGDSHSNLYQLLLTLHKYAPPVLAIHNVNLEKTLLAEIERNITVAAEPMLTHLICECDFQKEFLKNCSQVKDLPENRLPHLTLMVSVMKKLSALSCEDKDPWLGELKKSHIVGCLLEIMKYSHYELSCDIWLPAVVKSGQAPRVCDLYESLCCHCAGLILSFNSDQFERVEALMLDSLLEPFVWPVMFVAEVLSICARAGSAELVLDQVLYLADIAVVFEPAGQSERSDCTIFSLFLRRMCSFLSSKGKQTLFEKYPPSKHPLQWYGFGLECLSKEMRETVSQLLVARAVSDIQNFSCSNPNTSSFISMVHGLFGLCAALEISPLRATCESVIPGIIGLWQFACRGDLIPHFSNSEHFIGGSKWLQNFLMILCRCTEYLIHSMNNGDIEQVLNQLVRLAKQCDVSLKFSISQILHGLATKTLEPTSDQGSICSKLSCLFTCLLEDNHPLVKEIALETFEYFAHFTVHESIVPDAVANNVSITEVVTSYLQKEIPPTHSKVKTLRDYLTFQSNMSCEHKCEARKSRSVSPIASDQPMKKIRLECDDSDLSAFLDDDLLTDFVDKDVADALNRIIKDTEYLISQCSYKSLPSSSKLDLKKTVDDLNKFLA